MGDSTWVAHQLSHLLPLDDASLKQILDYTSNLPTEAAAKHLGNLLGDSPKALDFISSYIARRDPSRAAQPSPEVSRPPRKLHKKKAPLNSLPRPRQVEDYGNTAGAYKKREEKDYMSGKESSRQEEAVKNSVFLSDQPDARHLPKVTPAISTASSSKPPPSAAGPLISDLPNVRSGSRMSSRTSSPAPKTKINVVGGASMHGASTTLQDLDSAIRTLEIQTNPSLAHNASPDARRCNCNATRHPLLVAAPNCLSCGKIICVKEGIGPCTFCSTPLLSSSQIQSMLDSLRQERGQERMNLNNASHRRAELASSARPFQSASKSADAAGSNPADKTLDLAKQHRDRLLNYQVENAKRTHIIDEAADFETPTAGLSMWSSPVERAAQLKKQQKILREQEWNAKPEYEKRRVVASIDLVGGKVVKRMADVEKPTHEDLDVGDKVTDMGSLDDHDGSKGTFSKNPLIGNLIRPIWKTKGKETDSEAWKEDKENQPRQSTWRRVQDDNDDNEEVILNGGVYGGREDDRILGEDEHAYG